MAAGLLEDSLNLPAVRAVALRAKSRFLGKSRLWESVAKAAQMIPFLSD